MPSGFLGFLRNHLHVELQLNVFLMLELYLDYLKVTGQIFFDIPMGTLPN